ncbi:hypothetical protein [Cellulomonas sp. HZM]|uniref:hypothetical protein n=1 Tax=Cellulomonas sp. HZM TaxID=1454010 RepID=UPI00068F58FE|nr:hypothetical protein [Cellulomonas sp. HZM]
MSRQRPRARRTLRSAAVAQALLLGLVLAGCSGTPDPRPVTGEEAQRLAVARLSVYEAHLVDLDLQVPVQGQTLHMSGRADMRTHAASVVVTTQDRPPRYALLQWDLDRSALLELPSATAPATLPTTGWQVAAIDPTDALGSALRITLNLASDRPENPVLLQQNGAQLVGTDTVDGTKVDVFTAPGADGRTDERLHYLVDAKGTLHRVDADTGADDHLVITLRPSSSTAPVTLTPSLG